MSTTTIHTKDGKTWPKEIPESDRRGAHVTAADRLRVAQFDRFFWADETTIYPSGQIIKVTIEE